MKPEETPPPGLPNPETPPASLTAVRVGRRKAAAPPSGKPGDLTQRLGADTPADARPASRSAVSPAAGDAAEPPPAIPLEPTPTLPPASELLRAGAPPQLAPEPLPPSPAAEPRPTAAPPPPTWEPPPARLLGEDEIRQLLDPPERRAAPPPPPAPEPQPSLMVDPGERDAVPPAPAAPELRLVAEGRAAAPKADAPAEGPPAADAPTSSIDQIIDYWDSLRGDKPFPALDALDRGHVRRSWPNCLLVAYGAANTVTPRLTRIGDENGEIEYQEMVIHWILSRGQLAARGGEPMEEEKRFPVSGGNARYQLLLLPLATADGKSEHVLCHLTRVKEVAKGGVFKRWLAS